MQFSRIELPLKKFEPLVKLHSGHTQTILGHILPSKTEKYDFEEFILDLEDRDCLFLQYIDRKSKTTVSIFHGLAGNSDSDYMRRTADVASSKGWNLILVNHRGAHPKAYAAKTYHSGRGDDASAVLSWAKKRFPGSRQIAVGFSMSGSILLNLITGKVGTELPDFAIVVNAPLDLRDAAFRLSKGLSKIYDLRFYFLLKDLIQRRGLRFELPVIGRTYDVDDAYTSKLNGFENALDYYDKCSTYTQLEKIKIKTFILSSEDDPFISHLKYQSASWNENAHVTLIKHGGHMGYISKNKDVKYGRRWLDHYLATVFEFIENYKS
jgi:predicted alpha/beta-fold hydrolase